MDAKATISSGYRWRLGVIAVACLAFCAWFFYDGFVNYPNKQAVHQKYLQMQKDHPQDFRQQWTQWAQQHGQSTNPPAPYTDTDILTQYIFAGLTLVVGLLFGWAYLRTLGRWVAADDEGLHTSWGDEAMWSWIKSIDKARWKTKGIAVVHYADEAAAEHRLTLDDWKYEREPITAIVAEVDSHLGGETAQETGEPIDAATETDMTPAERKASELAS